jgi:hypothetical protein
VTGVPEPENPIEFEEIGKSPNDDQDSPIG